MSQLFKNARVKTRLYVLVGFSVFTMILISSIGLIGMNQASKGLETVYHDRVIVLKEIKFFNLSTGQFPPTIVWKGAPPRGQIFESARFQGPAVVENARKTAPECVFSMLCGIYCVAMGLQQC